MKTYEANNMEGTSQMELEKKILFLKKLQLKDRKIFLPLLSY